MDFPLSLGVSPFAKATGDTFSAASPKTDAGSNASADASVGQSMLSDSTGVDAAVLAGAFRSLVDELMGPLRENRADDASPIAKTPVTSEADDLEATLAASNEDDSSPQVWLVELEIINRASGIQLELPYRPTPPKNSDALLGTPDDSLEGIGSPGGPDSNDALSTLLAGNASAFPTICAPSAPIALVPVTPEIATTAVAEELPTDAGPDTTAARSVAEMPSEPVPQSMPSKTETQKASDTNKKSAESSQDPRQPVATPQAHATTRTESREVVEPQVTPVVLRSPFPVRRSGSGFTAQRSGVTPPEGVTQNAELGTLNQNPEPGTGNAERTVNIPEPAPAQRSAKVSAKTDVSSARLVDTPVPLAANALNPKQSGDTPDRNRRPESPAIIARPIVPLVNDLQSLATLAITSGAHDLLAGRTATTLQPAVVATAVPMNPASLPEDTARQIVQSIKFQITRGGGEATIRLEPRHFGELSITVRVDQGQVTARLQAESPVVREYLQSHQGLLRESLADQHLTLGKFEIAEPPAESRSGERRSDEDRGFHGDRQSQRRRQPAPKTPFEPFEVVA